MTKTMRKWTELPQIRIGLAIAAGAAMLQVISPLPAGAQEESGQEDADSFRADQGPVELAPYVVTASREATEILKTPASVVVFEEVDLRKPGNKILLEPLNPVPGVKINQRQNNGIFGGGIDLRGLSTNATSGGNVLILVDGVPQRRLSFGGPYFGAVPFDAADRMELAKGALTSQYGRGAMVGTLQLFTLPETPGERVTAISTYESETEFLKQTLSVTTPISLGSETGALKVTASFDDAKGWQDRTNSTHGNVYLSSELPLSASDTLRLSGGFYRGYEDLASQLFIDREGNLGRYLDWDDNLSVLDHNFLEVEEARFAAGWEHAFDDSTTLEFTAAYWSAASDWGVSRPWGNYAGSVGAFTAADCQYQTLDWDETGIFTNLGLTRHYQIGENLGGFFVTGLQYDRYTWDNASYNFGTVTCNYAVDAITASNLDFSRPPAMRDSESESLGGYFVNTLEWGDDVTLYTGLRYDTFDYSQTNPATGTSVEDSREYLSPSAGASWRFYEDSHGAASLFANWGKNFTPNTRTGVSASIADVTPERSSTLEGGIKIQALDRRIEGEISAFHVNRSDVLQNIANVPVISDSYEIDGMETAISVRPVDFLQLYANFSLIDPKIEESKRWPGRVGNRIAFVSEHLFKAGATIFCSEDFNLGMDARYTSDTFADSANTVRVPDYWLASFNANYTFQDVTLSLFIHNLTDQRYIMDVFDDSNGLVFAGTPRTVGLSVRCEF